MVKHGNDFKKSLNKTDFTKSIFYTLNEKYFFYAVRKLFPTDLIYPNAPLKSIVEFDGIKNNLTEEEAELFNHALINEFRLLN